MMAWIAADDRIATDDGVRARFTADDGVVAADDRVATDDGVAAPCGRRR